MSEDLTIEECVELCRMAPMEYLSLVRRGVSPLLINALAVRMGVSKAWLRDTLGLANWKIQRQNGQHQRLLPDASSRVLGICRLIGQVQVMVETSGNPEDFGAAAWFGGWLDQPLPALGGDRPAGLMDTAEGQAAVWNLIRRMQAGVFG